MLIGDCVRAAKGRAAGGVILYTLRYWHPRMVVEARGERWRADTEADWAELLGMANARSFNRALLPLIESGLVTKIVTRFGGKQCVHLRLTGVVSGSTGYPEVGIHSNSGYPEVGISGYPEVVIPINNSYEQQIQEKSSGENQVGEKLDSIGVKTGMEGPPDPKVEPEPKPKPIKKGPPVKASNVSEGFEPTIPPEECYKDNPTTPTMYAIWRGAHARAYGGAMSTQPWNGVEKKLVESQLIARVEDKAALQRAFAHAVEQWPAFSEYARKQTEWFNPPERPSLTMLCKYPAVMVDFWRGGKKQKEVAGQGMPADMNKL